MCKSRTMRSGFLSRTFQMDSSPSLASPHTSKQDANSRMPRITPLMSSESATNKILLTILREPPTESFMLVSAGIRIRVAHYRYGISRRLGAMPETTYPTSRNGVARALEVTEYGRQTYGGVKTLDKK